ncbi:hypothetical protein BH11MYX4_BH11MYX4_59160 [soil metagenome]
MFFTVGKEESLATVGQLAGVDDASVTSPGDLKAAYLGWLRKKVEPVALGAGGIEPDFVDDAETERQLLRGFITRTDGTEKHAITDASIAKLIQRRDRASVKRKSSRMSAASQAMKGVDPELAKVFGLVVNRVFIAELEGEAGGSSPRHTGVIWANPPAKASDWDLVEYLLHEFTHHILYLDEHLHGHYRRVPGIAAGEDVHVRSVIRKTDRPLRAAFHSLFVGLELLWLRRCVETPEVSTFVHPPSEPLLEACQETIRAITAIPRWQDHFRPRGRYLFDACRRGWEALASTAPEAGVWLFDAC